MLGEEVARRGEGRRPPRIIEEIYIATLVSLRGWEKYSSIGIRWRLGHKLLRVHAGSHPCGGSEPSVGGGLLERRVVGPESFPR